MKNTTVNVAGLDGSEDWDVSPVPCDSKTKGRLFVTATGSTLLGAANVYVTGRKPKSFLRRTTSDPGGWVLLTTVAVDASGGNEFDTGVFDLVASAVKVEYKKTSGTGTMTADLVLSE